VSADATRLVREFRAAREGAGEELFALIYDDLRQIASYLLRHERADHTLEPTALVHEAYMRLIRQDQADPQDQVHFRAVAARAMRQVLVDHARGRNRKKRHGQRDRVPLDTSLLRIEESTNGVDPEVLDAALVRLGEINARAAEVVQMRFFGGLTAEGAAAVLGVSVSTVEREWRYARAWLRRRLACGTSA